MTIPTGSSQTEASGTTSTSKSSGEVRGSTGLCVILGALFILFGLYYLLVDPGAAADTNSYLSSSSDVVSLQKLFMGATFTICGAIFLAAAWRPRP